MANEDKRPPVRGTAAKQFCGFGRNRSNPVVRRREEAGEYEGADHGGNQKTI
jgi:hypothetical protein